jgi:uncharacterized membrane protein YphA (DoxX/SURF4 family)
MNAILSAGKWLYAIPFLVFASFHFLNTEMLAGVAPFGGSVIVYITGLALIAASVSMMIGKYDKLASVLLAVMLLLFAILVHAPGGADSMGNLLKDTSLAGAALMYAKHVAKDNSVIG